MDAGGVIYQDISQMLLGFTSASLLCFLFRLEHCIPDRLLTASASIYKAFANVARAPRPAARPRPQTHTGCLLSLR